MSRDKQFGREASVYLAGFIGAGLIQFLTIPIYARALGPEQFGLLSLTIAATTVMSGVMLVGGDVALARFWFDARTESDQRELASTWIAFLTAWSVGIAFVAVLLTPWLAGLLRPGTDLAVLLAIALLGLVPAQLSRMLAQVLRNQFRPIPFAVTTVLAAGLNAAFGTALGIAMGLGVFGVVLGTLLGEATGCVVRLPLVRSALGWHLRRRLLPPLLRFGAPLVPASVATWVFNGADRLVVGAHSTEAELGAYGLVVMFVAPFTVLTVALGQAWVPRISQVNASSPDQARAATARVTMIATAVYLAAATTVGAWAPTLVLVFGGSQYVDSSATQALPLLVLGAAFSGTTLFASTGLLIAKRTGPLPIITFAAAALDLLLLVLLVPRLGAVGASLAVAMAYLVMSASVLVLSIRALSLKVPVGRLAALALLGWVQSGLNATRPSEVLVLVTWLATLAVIAVMTRGEVRAARSGDAGATPEA